MSTNPVDHHQMQMASRMAYFNAHAAAFNVAAAFLPHNMSQPHHIIQGSGCGASQYRGKTGDSNGVYSKGITIGHIINQVLKKSFAAKKSSGKMKVFGL